MRNFVLGFLVAAVILGGGFFAYITFNGQVARTEQKAVKYHCPMHPTYVSDKPGNCPICGMKLVPIDQESAAPAPAVDQHAGHDMTPRSNVPGYAPVMIPPERVQMMGITLAEARRMELDQAIRTYGRVTYDETRMHHVHTKFEGFIEDLYVNYVGQFVRMGQPLFTVYSPELYATQNEYLLALRAREQTPVLQGTEGNGPGGKIDLVAAARQRLALWDVDEHQISEVERTRKPFRTVTIHSHVSGYVIAKTAVEGLKIMPGENLYDVVDLSAVWVLADIYEINLPMVRLGQPATMTLSYQPGKTWRGRVVFIDPTVDPTTRTVKARLEFANPGGELKPEMYADVVIGGVRATGVAIPESAVIATGERNIVFVARGGGVFEPRQVVTGAKVRDWYEIKQGVAEGEQVVTGANFLLDSESKLKAAVSGAPIHQHGS